ncbi:MAG: ABC transporter substrate-binding protein [Deltaproteobacteria bacterium]|nr:ABC transporter substrate-binding protein [Deltaproteobacteria bacterium]
MGHLLVRYLPVFFLAISLAPAFASSPTEQIQETIQQVLTVVNDSGQSDDTSRKRQLRETLMPRFDWSEMAKQTLGKHWDAAHSRQGEFIAALAEFLGNSYIGKIGAFKDEKIIYLNETVERDEAQVRTRIVSSKGGPTAVTYRLHRVDGEWKIYDVAVEDISLVANYRSQFSRILSRGGFDDLLRQLKEKELTSK